MTNSRQSRQSIIAPVLLIAAGIAALLVVNGPVTILVFGHWYARWWPILLMAIGLMALAEWWADRGTGIRRSHHYVPTLILVLLGVVLSHAEHIVQVGRSCAFWQF